MDFCFLSECTLELLVQRFKAKALPLAQLVSATATMLHTFARGVWQTGSAGQIHVQWQCQ